MATIVAFFIVSLSILVSLSSQVQQSDSKLPLSSFDTLDFTDFQFIYSSSFNRDRLKRNIENQSSTPLFISTSQVESRRFKFTALNRTFDIRLQRNTQLTSDNLSIEVRYSNTSKSKKDEEEKKNRKLSGLISTSFFTGRVVGTARSYVSCYIEEKEEEKQQQQPIIYAQIYIRETRNSTTKDLIYYVEPLIEKKKEEEDEEEKIRYLVYSTSEIVNSDVVSQQGVFNRTVCHAKHVIQEKEGTTEKENLSNNESEHEQQNRLRRQASSSTERKEDEDKNKEKRNRCHVALVADHRFFKEIGNLNAKLTAAYLINVMGSVNAIFTRTRWALHDIGVDVEEEGSEADKFTPTSSARNSPNNEKNEEKEEKEVDYGFSVQKVIVLADPEATSPSSHFNSPQSSTSSDTILEQFGLAEDWTDYCLAHLFTFQTFENNVLGLAYVSSPWLSSLGGICSPQAFNSQSVNTGLSSYKSISARQIRLLQREAELVTAHELGHNWGSEHDPFKRVCTPGSSNGGNYLMYAYSNQGHETNNYAFSPCSVQSISQVLKHKAPQCFKPAPSAYCGNARVEPGEECDAGVAGRQEMDKCCDSRCRLRTGAQCSPANHYCCDSETCGLASQGTRCYSSSNYIECFEDHSYCTGKSRVCPSQAPRPANTTCHSYDGGKCSPNGQCMSLCQQFDKNFRECHCDQGENNREKNHVDRRTAQLDRKCMICCSRVTSFVNETVRHEGQCRPIHEAFGFFYGPQPILLSDGRACADGMCMRGKCQAKVKDHVGRLWKVIREVTVSGFVEFMKRNIVGTVILLSLCVWVPLSCCVHFCIDKRNKQEAREKIYQIRSEQIKEQQAFLEFQQQKQKQQQNQQQQRKKQRYIRIEQEDPDGIQMRASFRVPVSHESSL